MEEAGAETSPRTDQTNQNRCRELKLGTVFITSGLTLDLYLDLLPEEELRLALDQYLELT